MASTKTVIISSIPDLEIGKIYLGLTKGPWYQPLPGQCYKVVAHSTEQEWIECLVAFHGEDFRDHFEMLAAVEGPWFYYEIQTD
ncbi:MAG TPA: hypothetical protein VHF05_00385 [Candidatus Paceibacterota bacterium]|jgi:hypothetical protein|nr:hypothetical protein [Candidatus Paceibacterota bacterium]